MDIGQVKEVYFVGIGGIGMSALARYFKQRGLAVSGYDKTATELTRKLEEEGIAIHYQPESESLPQGEQVLFVYTPAVPQEFPELAQLRERGTPVYKRAEVLGLISRSGRTIGIAGTHGKTTTTTLTTQLLSVAGLQPSAFLGGIANNFSGNYVHGDGPHVVVEADEYDRSFLQLTPEIAVILSMDPDHLDIYGDHSEMLNSGFLAFARQVKEEGLLLVRYDLIDQIGPTPARKLTFGLGAGDYNAHQLRVLEGTFQFDLRTPAGHIVPDLRLPLPGRHNVENATAAAAIALELGANEDLIRRGLAEFSGIARRFDIRLQTASTVVVDDYAHHPTELTATIAAAREFYPGRTIRGVFQPHLFSRTRDFADGFAQALDELDEIILLPIYPAREEPIAGVDSRLIFNKLTNKKKRLLGKDDLMRHLAELREGVLLLMGAGDIDTLVNPIVHQLETLD
ncbi:MAG: UDP-N-acetylmuramate--L-alanine ligase [Bacteroidota bacterium]